MAETGVDLRGKTCVVTGGNGGIGFVTARELMAAGATVWIVGRSPERCEAAAGAIRAFNPAGQGTIAYLIGDLSSQQDVRRVVEGLWKRVERIDVLVNNAGAFFPKRETSADGFEKTFALNHLAYHTLTLGVLKLLRRAPAARIVNVASEAHRGVRSFDLEAFTRIETYRPWRAYCLSKLANVLFSNELARRLEGSGVTSNALHPGFVASNFFDFPGFPWNIARSAVRLMALSPEKGALTSLHVATAPSLTGASGRYFDKCEPVEASPVARDPENARELWSLCEKTTGVVI